MKETKYYAGWKEPPTEGATCYIAGPMRGIPGCNFDAFDEMAMLLENKGWDVINPAELDRKEGYFVSPDDPCFEEQAPRDEIIERDHRSIMDLDPETDAVFLLPGWDTSVGALAEVAVARWRGVDIVLPDNEFPVSKEQEPFEYTSPEEIEVVLTEETEDAARPGELQYSRPGLGPQFRDPRQFQKQSIPCPGDPRLHALLKKVGDLHDRKQADYGTDGDPFANVRASQEFGVPPWIGALVRLNDKVTRLKQFAKRGSLANESAKDSMLDIAVYALIAYILYEEEE